MKNILGFTAPAEAEEQTMIPELVELTAEIPVKSLVQVRFVKRPMHLSYYNDKFDLKVGDFVRVTGALAEDVGVVTSVTTKFRIRARDYHRVVARLDLSLRGSFHREDKFMVAEGQNPLTPERIRSWFGPTVEPDDEDECPDEILSGEGYTLDLKHPDPGEVSQSVMERGHIYYQEDRVKYLSVQNGVGCAFVEGGRWYQVDFCVDENGALTELYCDCPYAGLCKHAVATAVAMNHVYKNRGFVALEQRLFWKLVSLNEEITI